MNCNCHWYHGLVVDDVFMENVIVPEIMIIIYACSLVYRKHDMVYILEL